MQDCDALVIGGGPAGLMAADVISEAGYRVSIADRMPSLGRKFLMAGKSGLNLTKQEDLSTFMSRYDSDWIAGIVSEFGPQEVQGWARDLGQDVFTGSTGRVFPKVMKASPLLRAWLARLDARGVRLHRRWRFLGWQEDRPCFETPDGPRQVSASVTILALGGGSWARLGSDGLWAQIPELAAQVVPFQPSNTGLLLAWTHHMTPHFGKPIKAVRWSVTGPRGDVASSRGEAVLSERGLEGGGLYPLIPALRMPGTRLVVDLAPDQTLGQLQARLSAPGTSLRRMLRNALRWPPQKVAFFQDLTLGQNLSLERQEWAARIKALPVPQNGPRPLDEAISTAGGLVRDALTEGLELRDRSGVFACGEMLDWDAPTGGYLLTACLATGRRAGRSARDRLRQMR